MEIKKRYLELKRKAKKAMLEGKMKSYLQLLTQAEELNFVMIRIK
jgi:hypothetical protein